MNLLEFMDDIFYLSKNKNILDSIGWKVTVF